MKKTFLSKFRSMVLLAAPFVVSPAMAAYFQADLPSAKAQPAVGTHLMIAGKGLEVGDQWLRAAHTQALLFKDKAHHGSIRMIGAIENANTLSMLKTWGYQNIQVFDQTFTGSRLNQLLAKQSRIASMDWIGHNGAVVGFVLEDYSNRFFLNEARDMTAIASKMTRDSYVRLMGCNTGWNLAPTMAKALGVPVAGTFTFADIQKLHETNNWYYHDDGRFPGGKFLKQNSVSYTTPINCSHDGGCLRLKPVSIAYQGKHGNYGGTIPFLKYFCGTVGTGDCQRRMALSMMSFASTTAFHDIPTAAQYHEVLADFFCPAYKDFAKLQACRQAIINHANGTKKLSSTFTTSSAKTVACDLYSCQVQKDCSSGSCVMIGTADGASTTFVDELNAYLRGYQSYVD